MNPAHVVWNKLHFTTKLMVLEGETLIGFSLLAENPLLIQMIKSEKSKQECIQFINENF
jgi:hypothetical protein